MGVVAVILAGGRGRRFGGNKLLARVPGGRTVIEMVVAAARSSPSVEEVVLAVRSRESGERLSAMLGVRYLVDSVREEGPHAGMLTALGALDYEEYLFVPGDAPRLRGETLDRLVSLARSSNAACASPLWGNGIVEALLTYCRRSGVWPEGAPVGLKRLRPSDLHRSSGRTVLVGVSRLTESPEELSNVNRPEDLARPRARGPPTDRVVALEEHCGYYRRALSALRDGDRRRASELFALEAGTYARNAVYHLAYHAYLDCASLGGGGCERMASEARRAMGVEALHG